MSAIALASDPAHFRHAVYAIEKVWREFRVHHVIKADAGERAAGPGLHWILALLTGGWLVHPPRSLFDNTPLWELLRKNLDFDGIPRGMYKQHLQAVGICATSYSEADSVTFYACAWPIEPWTRAARKGARVQLTLRAPDGEPVHSVPVSPHLPASAILRRRRHAPDLALESGHPPRAPTACWSSAWATPPPRASACRRPARRADLRPDVRLHARFAVHGSAALGSRAHQAATTRIPTRARIESLVLTPSRDLSEIARRHRSRTAAPACVRCCAPWARAPAAPAPGRLLSYLLFERGYTRELIALGLADARARAEEIRAFLAESRGQGFRQRVVPGEHLRVAVPEVRGQLLGDVHRAMLAAGAADRDGQIAAVRLRELRDARRRGIRRAPRSSCARCRGRQDTR